MTSVVVGVDRDSCTTSVVVDICRDPEMTSVVVSMYRDLETTSVVMYKGRESETTSVVVYKGRDLEKTSVVEDMGRDLETTSVGEGITSNSSVNISLYPSIPSKLSPPAAPSPCTTQTPCKNITQYITQPPVVARHKIYWNQESPCEGQLYLSSSKEHDVPLCSRSHLKSKWLNDMCKDRRCGAFEGFKSTKRTEGYHLSSNMTVSNASCFGVHITCQDTLRRELAVYKAVTGILLFLILSVILLQFGRPTYKAIHKRFSKKRQNRWIGPTQSQSVSYHRGQAGSNPNNNTLKGPSFPGLDRLTVNPSREPSSNRNSDYDSFGYN
ncbi:uncharacterized protein LOC127651316 [Xyrauchen texanus]|uniref:uncharacterized protein LOC127651316 n=1 Tax=Xyrauchen texanus TaxID=154827 RepID=UPI002242C346|nr:uncharacterized protein LOC127651316 [Xyrauchen texanus]